MGVAASSAIIAASRFTALISSRGQEARKSDLDNVVFTEEVLRTREELSEQIRALGELNKWPPVTVLTLDNRRLPRRPCNGRISAIWLRCD